ETPRLGAQVGAGIVVALKREDLNHTGAHKINNTLGQALLARRMGKRRIIAETGAGQHGVATATVCARFGLECVVYMGEADMRRQRLNVYRMELMGARVVPVTSGSRTLKDATNEALRDWVTNVTTTHYIIGSVVGPDPFPRIVRDFQSVIGREARGQVLERWGRLPGTVVACVGGGSNAMGIFSAFLDDRDVALVGVEAAGEGVDTDRHAASLGRGRPGVFHGSLSYLLQSADGQVQPAHSVSAGLDYPGVGPEHAYLKDSGRVLYEAVTDRQAFREIWQATDDLVFDVGETELRCEDNVVYNQDQRNESIAWTLFKDGVRSLSFRPGVEEIEIVRFLGVLQQARNLQADAPDDLLTLLWAQDFQFVAYTFRELASENAVPIEKGETIPSTAPPQVRQQVQDEAPPKREGLVSIDDFDTTLYFLEDG